MPSKKGTNTKTSATGETDTDTKNLHQKKHDEENQEPTENGEQKNESLSPKKADHDDSKLKKTDSNKTGRTRRKSETELLQEEAAEFLDHENKKTRHR